MFSTLILPVLDAQQIAQGFAGQLDRDLFLVEARVRQDLAQRTFEFAHVGAHVLGHEESDFFGHFNQLPPAPLLIRMATRISSSGGSIATVRPESKRDTRRSWMSASPLG
jgi:hypothetical protein